MYGRRGGSSRRLGGAVSGWALVVVAVLASGCATTGSTFGSGVGDRLIERPPFYAGAGLGAGDARLAHLPIVFATEDGEPDPFAPETGEGSAVAGLLASLNAHLEATLAGTSEPLIQRISGTAPDVRFGCERDVFGDCREISPDAIEPPYLHLSVARPSSEWAAGLAAAMDRVGAEHALVISLEVSEYWPRQRNFRGDKEVELGTGYTMPLPWLTAIDRPMQVLQLTGAIVDRQGRALRIGAEGMLARRTGLLAGAVGFQALITDDEVERLMETRRQDLPEAPLVWEVALENLVWQLTAPRG